MDLNKNSNEVRPYLKVDKIHWEMIPVKKPYSKRVAFFDLLDLCSYPPRTVKVRGAIVALQQNQGCPSLTFLEQRWGWKDVRKVARFLQWLSERDIIQLKKHPVVKCNLIKVVIPNVTISATKKAPSTFTDNQTITKHVAPINAPTIATQNANNTIKDNSSNKEEKNDENSLNPPNENSEDQVKQVEIFEKRKNEFLDYLNSEAGQLAWNTFLNGDEQLKKKQFTQDEMLEQVHSMFMNFLNSEYDAMRARLHHKNHQKIEYLRQWLLKDFRKSNKEKSKIEAQRPSSGNQKSAPIDLLTLTEEVKTSGDLEMIGGPFALVELTNRVASSANIEYHARILVQKYLQRNLIKLSTDTIKAAYEDTTDVFDLYDNLEIKLMNTKDQIRKGANKSNINISMELMKDIEKAKMKENGIIGIPIFGISELDEMLNGAEEDDFILIAGRPSMGKSSLANSIIINAIENDIPLVMWSIEMTSKKTFARAVSGLSGVPYKTIIRGQANPYEHEAIMKAFDKINNSKIIFREDPVNIHEFRSQVISMKQKHGIQAVIFDRIGLFTKTDPKHNDFNHISEVSPILRRTANELKIPMIIISQLSRAVETRGGTKRPMLSDLRNSGSLEQDATKVIFCYRPEYYEIMEDEDGNSTKGKGELIVAKNSNGQSKTVQVAFQSQCMIYKPITEEEKNEANFWNNAIQLSQRVADEDVPF
jgi:replicative DNA helicase